MRSLVLSIALLFLVLASYSSTSDQPNVVLINVDDLGWMDVGYKNPELFNTPNIDKLRTQGMEFVNAYAGAANCAPSRACLLSGQNTPRHGVYTVSPSTRGNPKTRKVIPTQNTKHLTNEVVTLPELFKQAGYTTANFGKWHVGAEPREQGIDVNVAGGANGNPGKGGYFSPYNIPNISNGSDGEYLTDRITTEAIRYFTDNKNRRFFAYIPFYTVHTPLLPREDLYDLYQSKPGYQSEAQRKYAAMVHGLDENVGRLLAALDALGLTDKTMVIFTSDNGGIAAISSQNPARAGKGSYFQGGLKVPFLVRWPGTVPEFVSTTTPTVNMDIYGTILDLLKLTPSQAYDGLSILPTLKGRYQDFSERSFFWHFPIYLQAYAGLADEARDPLFRTRPGSVILKGKWKLHQYFESGELLLFDIENDPGEASDVSGDFPEVVKSLFAELYQWQKNMSAPTDLEDNSEYDSAFEAKMIEKKSTKK